MSGACWNSEECVGIIVAESILTILFLHKNNSFSNQTCPLYFRIHTRAVCYPSLVPQTLSSVWTESVAPTFAIRTSSREKLKSQSFITLPHLAGFIQNCFSFLNSDLSGCECDAGTWRSTWSVWSQWIESKSQSRIRLQPFCQLYFDFTLQRYLYCASNKLCSNDSEIYMFELSFRLTLLRITTE